MALMFLATNVASCGSQPRDNILLIVVDTLRADHLGSYGYRRPTSPALDELASTGTRFDRAFATAPWTKPSVASMLTGLYPGAHTVEHMTSSLPDSMTTLPEILMEAGYGTGGVVSHKLISRAFRYSQGFEHFEEKDAQGHKHVSTPSITDSAIEMLDLLSQEDRPFFLFTHYFDPHFAYQRHAEYGFSSPGEGRLRGGQSMQFMRQLKPPPDDAELQHLLDLYDEEIRFTDAGIGRLLEALKERGLAHNTIVVLTADHGEEFYEHGWLGHTRTLYDEVLRVPLIIRLPREQGAGRVIETPVSLVALAATLLDAVGISQQGRDFHGRSLLGLMDGSDDTAPQVYSEIDYDEVRTPMMLLEKRSAYMRAIVKGNYKLVHDRYTDQYELYDLLQDAGELNDLSDTRPTLMAELQAELTDASKRAAPKGGFAETYNGLSEQDREMLRNLGYVID